MKRNDNVDIFSNNSSSLDSSVKQSHPFNPKKSIKETENYVKTRKPIEIKDNPIDLDSDSSRKEEKLSFVDLTYEQFLERKEKHPKNLQSKEENMNDLERKIKDLKTFAEKSFVKNEENSQESSSFDLSEEKLYEKYQEIKKNKVFSIKKEEKSLQKGSLYQELEDMK